MNPSGYAFDGPATPDAFALMDNETPASRFPCTRSP